MATSLAKRAFEATSSVEFSVVASATVSVEFRVDGCSTASGCATVSDPDRYMLCAVTSPPKTPLDATDIEAPNVAAAPTDRLPPRTPLLAAVNCPKTRTSLEKVEFDDTTSVERRSVPWATKRSPAVDKADVVVRGPTTVMPLQNVASCATDSDPARSRFDALSCPATTTESPTCRVESTTTLL